MVSRGDSLALEATSTSSSFDECLQRFMSTKLEQIDEWFEAPGNASWGFDGSDTIRLAYKHATQRFPAGAAKAIGHAAYARQFMKKLRAHYVVKCRRGTNTVTREKFMCWHVFRKTR